MKENDGFVHFEHHPAAETRARAVMYRDCDCSRCPGVQTKAYQKELACCVVGGGRILRRVSVFDVHCLDSSRETRFPHCASSSDILHLILKLLGLSFSKTDILSERRESSSRSSSGRITRARAAAEAS